MYSLERGNDNEITTAGRSDHSLWRNYPIEFNLNLTEQEPNEA